MLNEEVQLFNSLKEGDVIAFEKIFKRYYSPLCNYIIGILNDFDEAEEVVQQTMINIWEKKNNLEITTSLKSYLYRSVHNAALNKVRQTKVRKMYAIEKVYEGEGFSEQASHKVIKTELELQIASSIEKLPQQCRMVFKLSRFEEMKYAEIAAHLDISIKTVENHMGKALKLLRGYLKDYLIWVIVFSPHYYN
ncbi:MAG: RNA polymerase sigma-70 factor [Bacteroidetes bacterium]|nr:RNA polymerase sigma-70 factor [Bacteroidota bacterium]